MRNFSIAFSLLVASASFANASVIQIACGSVQSVNNGVLTANTSVTCAAQNFGGGTNITNVFLSFAGSFSDPLPTPDKQLTFSGSSTLGAFGPFTTALSGLSGNTGFIMNLNSTNPNTAGFGPLEVNVTTMSTGGAIPNSGGYSVFATYTYEVPNPIPEPSTLALVGGVLVLAGIRKYRS